MILLFVGDLSKRKKKTSRDLYAVVHRKSVLWWMRMIMLFVGDLSKRKKNTSSDLYAVVRRELVLS